MQFKAVVYFGLEVADIKVIMFHFEVLLMYTNAANK